MIGQNIKNIITTNFVKFNGGGEGTQNGGSKYEFIYYLRIFSCILIILKHVSGSALDYFYDKNVYESINYIVLSSINNILWFAINIFFMITGYIFLSKNKKCTYTTIIKNIIKIFIYLIVFGIIFSFLLKIIGGRRLYSLSDFSNKIVNGELNIIDIFLNSIKDVIAMKNQWGHMWFMYEILKIYLLLPIIKSFVDSQKNNIYRLFIIALTFNLIIPFYSNIYQISIYNFFPVNFSIIMVLLGGIINRLNINIKNSAKFILLITFIIIIAKYISNNIINDNVAICNTKVE